MKAIILAAGLSSRMHPLTLKTHKGLLPVANTTIVEKQIHLLREAGIDEIYIIVGHCWKKFKPFVKSHGVHLIYNPHYATRNNLYSLYLASEHLHDAYIVEGDIYISENIFTCKITDSAFFVSFRKAFDEEWVIVEKKEKAFAIDIRSGNGNVIAGISYWTGNQARILVESMKNIVEVQKKYHLTWCDAIFEKLPSLNMDVCRLNENSIFEIDTINDYEKLKQMLAPISLSS